MSLVSIACICMHLLSGLVLCIQNRYIHRAQGNNVVSVWSLLKWQTVSWKWANSNILHFISPMPFATISYNIWIY